MEYSPFPKFASVKIAFEGIIKIKKSPSPHIYHRRIFLKHRMTMPFCLVKRYEHKEAFKHT